MTPEEAARRKSLDDLYGQQLQLLGRPSLAEAMNAKADFVDARNVHPRAWQAEQQNKLAEALDRVNSAPIGSVGAPGGVNPLDFKYQRPAPGFGPLDALSFVPVVGDVAGALADAAHYAAYPEDRTPSNLLWSALGLLPFVPSAGVIRPFKNVKAYRGSAEGEGGQFFSRDREYAKGFDKGQFSEVELSASRPITFGSILEPDDLTELFSVMRKEGDSRAADMIEEAVQEDGGVHGEMLYQMLAVQGAGSPEYYLKRAGFDAIDTGRDIRMLNW